MPPAPPPAAETRPADTPRARRARLAGVLALAACAGLVGWLSLRPGAAARDPAAIYDYVRDRVLAGDGEALWRVLLPEGRRKYAGFVKLMAEAGEGDAAAAAWKRSVGISRKELLSLPPEKVLAREYLAAAETQLRGSRVYRTVLWDRDTAYLNISRRDGTDKHWLVRRVEGAWKVSDPEPVVTAANDYLPGAGEKPYRIPVPMEEPR